MSNITHSASNNRNYTCEPDLCVSSKWIRICQCCVLTHVSASMSASALTYHVWCLITQQPLLTTLHLVQSTPLNIQYMYKVDAAPQLKTKVGVSVVMQFLCDLSSSVFWGDGRGHFQINRFWGKIEAALESSPFTTDAFPFCFGLTVIQFVLNVYQWWKYRQCVARVCLLVQFNQTFMVKYRLCALRSLSDLKLHVLSRSD